MIVGAFFVDTFETSGNEAASLFAFSVGARLIPPTSVSEKGAS
jgi:hypothetical protein